MREYVFSLTRIFPYKDRIEDSVLIRENTGQWKPVFSHILSSVKHLFLVVKMKMLLMNFSDPYFANVPIQCNAVWTATACIETRKVIVITEQQTGFYMSYRCTKHQEIL